VADLELAVVMPSPCSELDPLRGLGADRQGPASTNMSGGDRLGDVKGGTLVADLVGEHCRTRPLGFAAAIDADVDVPWRPASENALIAGSSMTVKL